MITVGHDAFISHPRRQSAGIHLSSLFTGSENPLTCRLSLLRRSRFGYEGWEFRPRHDGPFDQTQGMLFQHSVRA